MACMQGIYPAPLVEQTGPITVQSETMLTKIKEEIIDDDIDIGQTQIQPFNAQIKTEVEEQGGFIIKDMIAHTSTCLQATPQRRHKESPLESVEKFEEITVKEEVDTISTYCEMCNIKFDCAKQLEEHCILHNERDTYFCSFCLEIFKTKEGLLEHFIKHKEIEMLSKCNLCNYTFGSIKDLYMHDKIFQHIKQFSCDECGEKIFLKDNLTIRKRLHTNESLLCNICRQKFTHVKHDNKNTDGTYKYSKCCFITRNGTEETEHNANNDKWSKCNKCDFRAMTYAEIRKHHNVHLTDVTYMCHLCPYETHKKHQLTEHQVNHTEDNFKCKLCTKSFNLMKYLRRHMKRHANKDLLECEMCDFKCYKKTDLVKHQIIQNHKKMHKCETCGKKLTTKHSYKIHLSMHVGNEKYECILCSKRFVLRLQLLRHMKLLHPKADPLKCDVCDYKTFIQTMLEKHKIRHKELKPYVCSICKVGFNYKQSLKTHMASHLGLTPYECTLCDKRYVKRTTLNKHMLSHFRNAAAEESG